MSINEFSVGPLYIAFDRATKRWFPPHTAEITEMCEPWRIGKAAILPTGLYWLLAIGFWHRDIYDDIVEDFAGPNWIQVFAATTDEIREWSRGSVEEEDETGGTDPECGGTEGQSEETL